MGGERELMREKQVLGEIVNEKGKKKERERMSYANKSLLISVQLNKAFKKEILNPIQA